MVQIRLVEGGRSAVDSKGGTEGMGVHTAAAGVPVSNDVRKV